MLLPLHVKCLYWGCYPHPITRAWCMHLASLFPLIYTIRSSFPHISGSTRGIWVAQIIWLTSLSAAGAISTSHISLLEMWVFISSEERRIIRCCHITIHVVGHRDGCFVWCVDGRVCVGGQLSWKNKLELPLVWQDSSLKEIQLEELLKK